MRSAPWAWARRRCRRCATSTSCCGSTRRSSCARRRARSSSASSFATGTSRRTLRASLRLVRTTLGRRGVPASSGCARASMDSTPPPLRGIFLRGARLPAQRLRLSRTAKTTRSTFYGYAYHFDAGAVRGIPAPLGDGARSQAHRRPGGRRRARRRVRRHRSRSRSSPGSRSKATSSSTAAASARCCSATSLQCLGGLERTGCPAIARWAVPCERSADFTPYTRSTAQTRRAGSGAFRCNTAPAMATCSPAVHQRGRGARHLVRPARRRARRASPGCCASARGGAPRRGSAIAWRSVWPAAFSSRSNPPACS